MLDAAVRKRTTNTTTPFFLVNWKERRTERRERERKKEGCTIYKNEIERDLLSSRAEG